LYISILLSNTHCSCSAVGRLLERRWILPERGITAGGSEYAALLAHTGGALYGTELGSVTLKRIGFVCFPIKHSTHTLYGMELGSVTLKRIGFFCFPIKHSHTVGTELGSHE